MQPNPMRFLKDIYGNKGIVGVEVGVDEGATSKKLIKELNLNHLFLVDIWYKYSMRIRVPYRGRYKDKRVELDFSGAYKDVVKQFLFSRNVKVIKMSSIRASHLFEDDSLDFVYIDACHDYTAVLADIRAWYPKIKNGGVLCGHDYCELWCDSVNRAVDMFAKKKSREVNNRDWDWWITKD